MRLLIVRVLDRTIYTVYLYTSLTNSINKRILTQHTFDERSSLMYSYVIMKNKFKLVGVSVKRVDILQNVV